jgi:flagellar hook-basal body complex protein FliE
MLEKKAYSIQMSFNVPDSERRVAEKAVEHFEDLLSRMKIAVEYLDFIYVPFSEIQQADPEQVVENRVILRKYRDHIKEKFDKIMRKAYRCMLLMGEFNTDSAIAEMMTTFMAAMKDVEKQVNVLLSIFSNLNSAEFKNYLIASIDSVRKQVNQVRQLVNDRILEHIDTNILAKNWMSDLSERYHHTVKEKTPLVVELFKERQQALQSGK